MAAILDHVGKGQGRVSGRGGGRGATGELCTDAYCSEPTPVAPHSTSSTTHSTTVECESARSYKSYKRVSVP
eukprot:2531076-Prymnesium_polylepis.1